MSPTPMTREQAWAAITNALDCIGVIPEPQDGDDRDAAYDAAAFLRTEMERLEGDVRTVVEHEPEDCTDPECRWKDNPNHKHGRVEIHRATQEAMGKWAARAEAAEAQLAQAREALERMTHVYCGTNRVSQAVRWARQVLGWDYAKGCAESVEAVAKAHALARLEQGDKDA